MEAGLKVLSITAIIFCGLSLIGNAGDPENFAFSALAILIWVPQSILALLMVGKVRKFRYWGMT